MIRLLLIKCCMLLSVVTMANNITVKNIEELKKANKAAKPGDVITLQNGTWSDVIVELDCSGTKAKPITFKAETAGSVLISGHSQLKFGGNYIVVDGLYFVNGYAGNDAVIDFRMNKNKLANNCRITNSVVNDFNNAKRMDENYWVSLSGKNNRIDHCSFMNKKNMGVLMVVILDDERSRENFHSVDHNYFGMRLPLASNSGEIIRIGVSQHCEFNSNTQIVDNFFEKCDGETEIISVKSCSNVVRNNLFKECQGGVVLRHGHYNTVENNVFEGNDKEGTGGVRIINRGQWVVNNLFYKCRGEGFRSPLSIMNGVPNSPAFRYVAVTDAVIANNSFFNCAPISLCEGADTERTVSPTRVFFGNNIFFSNNQDKLVYNNYGDVSGIDFVQNMISTSYSQQAVKGFSKAAISFIRSNNIDIPQVTNPGKQMPGDSLIRLSKTRLAGSLAATPGLSDLKSIMRIDSVAKANSGAPWFTAANMVAANQKVNVTCKTAAEVLQQLSANNGTDLTINLVGKDYKFESAVIFNGNLAIKGNPKLLTKFSCTGPMPFFVQLKAGNTLTLTGMTLDLAGMQTATFITTDTSGSSNHSGFNMTQCSISNFNGTFFSAAKSSLADSIVVNKCSFTNNSGTLFNFTAETDKKGYYNVEKLQIINTGFTGNKGQILNILRGGNDESTMGPLVIFSNNIGSNCTTDAAGNPMIKLNGAQRTFVDRNIFTNCATGGTLLLYEDAVRAVHSYTNNIIKGSGTVIKNKFVTDTNNSVR